MVSVVQNLDPPKTDKEIAAEVKAKAEAALGPVLEVFDEAGKHQMILQWDAIQRDAFGRWNVIGLRIVKVL